MKNLLKLLGIKSIDELYAIEGLSDELKSKLKTHIETKAKDFEATFSKEYLPRSEFNDKNEALKAEVKTREDLEKTIKGLDGLGIKSVEDYNAKVKEITDGHQTKLDGLKKEEKDKLKAKKVEEAFGTAKAKNIDLLMKNIDLDKIEISDDGTIFGHQTQIDIQKEKYPTMFDKEAVEGADGGNKKNEAEISLKKGDEGFISEADFDAMSDADVDKNWETIERSSRTWG